MDNGDSETEREKHKSEFVTILTWLNLNKDGDDKWAIDRTRKLQGN